MRVFGWIPALVALWLCAIGIWAVHGVVGALAETRLAASALRLQGDSDMMHDALRADVLDRFLKGAGASPGVTRAAQEGFDQHATRFNENIAALEQLALTGKAADAISGVKPAIAAYIDAGRAAMTLDGGERDQARLSVFLQAWQALEDPMEQLGTVIEETAHQASEHGTSLVNYAYWGMGIGFILAVAGGLVATGILRRKITDPLRDVVALARAVSQGDLTHPLPTTGRDEIGEVVKAVGEMQTRLTEMLDQLRGSADALDATSTELVDGSRQVAQGSQTQSEAAMTMAAGVEELTASISEVNEGTSDAHSVSQQASEQCATSERLVRKVMEDMSALQVSVKDSAQVIHSLGEQSRSIRAIVQVIKDIADQTNLLALNAAIEAARAGEQGRGFAVVADEVRKLADRTGQSTQQIAQMIDAIQGSVDAAVTGMESGVQLVDSGSACAQEAVEAMGNVNLGVLKILGVVDNAAYAMKEQAAAANESAVKVSEVAESAERNAHVARNAAAGAEQLHYLATSIKQITSGFKTRSAG